MYNAEKKEQSLSVLCADIAGDERLSRLLDKPEALYAVGRCENRIRRAVESHGGYRVDFTGRKVMAFFNDSVDALQSAIEMQRRIAALPPYSGVPLSVRVGVCTGHQAQEAHYFPSEGSNPAASLSAIADPAHILLSIPKRVKRFPWLQLARERLPDLALSCGNRQLNVFRVAWQDAEPVVLKSALSQLGNGFDRLYLRYKGVELVLDGNYPALKIGRQADCDVVLRDTRTSRLHGMIERRQDRFVFVDCSTNGTFVTLEDEIEFFVRRKELMLFGVGQFSLGAPSSAPGVEIVEFQTGGFP